MNLLGIVLYSILVIAMIISLIWIFMTKKMIGKIGIVKFLLASILWNVVLVAAFFLVYYIAGTLPALYYSVYSEPWNKIGSIIYLAYHIMLRWIFPTYTAIIIICSICLRIKHSKK